MKAGWFIYVLVFVMALCSGAALMVVSHRVQHVHREIVLTERAMKQEADAIRILQAEWSYLNDPARLEVLASQYLDLRPPQSAQLISDVDGAKPQIPEEEIMRGPQGGNVHEVALRGKPVQKAGAP
jgi:cell division protein FtsL